MWCSPKAHKARILNAKKVRTWLLAHPGATKDEVREATGCGVGLLQDLGMASWKKDESGVARWTAKVNVLSRPWKDKPENQ